MGSPNPPYVIVVRTSSPVQMIPFERHLLEVVTRGCFQCARGLLWSAPGTVGCLWRVTTVAGHRRSCRPHARTTGSLELRRPWHEHANPYGWCQTCQGNRAGHYSCGLPLRCRFPARLVGGGCADPGQHKARGAAANRRRRTKGTFAQHALAIAPHHRCARQRSRKAARS